MSKSLTIALAGLAAASLLAVAPPAAAQEHGFLADYARLKRDTEGGVAYWIRADTDFKRFDRLLIERVRVSTVTTADKRATIDPDEMKMLSDYFRDAIRKEAEAGGWKFAEAPGPGVLRLRLLITDIQPNMPEIGLIVLAAPFGTLAEAALTGVATGTPGKAPYLGGVGLEAQFIDGQSNEPVAELQDKRAGNRLSTESGIEGLAQGYVSGLTQWGYVKQAFDYWAKWMRQRFEALRAAKAAG